VRRGGHFKSTADVLSAPMTYKSDVWQSRDWTSLWLCRKSLWRKNDIEDADIRKGIERIIIIIIIIII